jgi:hypothetical protein
MAVVTEGLQTTLQTLNIKLLIWMLLHGAGHWVGNCLQVIASKWLEGETTWLYARSATRSLGFSILAQAEFAIAAT